MPAPLWSTFAGPDDWLLPAAAMFIVRMAASLESSRDRLNRCPLLKSFPYAAFCIRNPPVKATLAVILKANDVVVAGVNDAGLWQRVLTAISGGGLEPQQGVDTKESNATEGVDFERVDRVGTRADTQPLTRLARKIGTEPALVEGGAAAFRQK